MIRGKVWFAVLVASVCAVGVAQRPAPNAKDVPKKVDWAGLRTLLEAGEYAKATAAADAILDVVKPVRKAPDFLSRCVDTIDALMRRGFAEFQLFQLDASDATFIAAQEVFKDAEFRKQISTMERQGGPNVVDPLISLDVRRIELQNLRAAVVLERLRQMHAGKAEVTEGAATTVVEDIRVLIEAIRGFVKEAADIRKKLAERFEEGGPSVVGSPHKRALMSTFHPELIEAIAALELSQLPFDLPPMPPAETAPKTATVKTLEVDGLNRRQLLEKSLVHFEAASKALDGALEKALPKGVAGAPADKRLEFDVLAVQLALARCPAHFQNGDRGGARKDVDELFKLHKEMAGLRKVASADSHPELLLPLLYSATLDLAESDEHFKTGMGDEARALVAKARESLTRASSLPVAEDHPRRTELARVTASLENQHSKLEQSVVTTDAAEVAARRIRRAVERTAPTF